MEKRLIIIYLTNLSYREVLWQKLAERTKLELWIGKKSPYSGLNTATREEEHIYKRTGYNLVLKIGKKKFVFQFFPLRWFLRLDRKKTKFILLGVDPHILSTPFYAFLLKILGFDFYWWGHGTLGKGLLRQYRISMHKLAKGNLVYGRNNDLIREGVKATPLGNCLHLSEPIYKEGNAKIGDTLSVAYIGRLTDSKNLDLLIDLALSEDFIYLSIFGTGPYEEVIKSKIIASRRINLFGYRSMLEIDVLLENIDVVVIPGKVGLAVLHSYLNSVPVLCHDKFDEHSPEIEVHTKSPNFLFKKDCVDSLRSRLVDLSSQELFIERELIRKRLEEYQYYPDIVASKIINECFG